MLYSLLFFWLMSAAAAEQPTCMAAQLTQENPIYGSWRLVDFTFTGKRESSAYYNTDEEIAMLRQYLDAGEQFGIHLDKAGDFRYNLDANSCWTSFQLLPNQRIKIGEAHRGAVCTELCCDHVDLNYWGTCSYTIEQNAMQLVCYDCTYQFVRTE